MENWNPEEWQGKRRDQYEFSARIVWYSALAIFILASVSTLIN